MFTLFRNFAKQYRFHQSFQRGFELIKRGKKEEAFNEFNLLLTQEPYNPYLRHQLLKLGKELHKEVKLPNLTEIDNTINKLPGNDYKK